MPKELPSFFNQQSKNTLVIPFDDAKISGIRGNFRDMPKFLSDVVAGKPDAVLGFKETFTAPGHDALLQETGKILNLTYSQTGPDHTRKIQIATVEDALRLGVDAVAVHVNANSRYAGEMFGTLERVVEERDRLGVNMPVFAFMEPRGEKADGSDENWTHLLSSANPDDQAEYTYHVIHAVRAGATRRADMIKAPLSENYHQVIAAAGESFVLMGRSLANNDHDLLTNISTAMSEGARGACTANNAIMSEQPEQIVFAMGQVIHQRRSPDEALELANSRR